MWGFANIMKILTNENYKGLLQLIADQKKEIIRLRQYNADLKKQLLYIDTYNKTFKNTMNELIFPNTDERGLGDQETPVDFPDLW